MMDLVRLLEQISKTRRTLFAEGHLNENFTVLENFEREYNMESFTPEALQTYYQKSASLLTQLEQELDRVQHNFNMLETLLNQIRKYTMSVGANNMVVKLNRLRDMVDRRRNARSCQIALRQLKLEQERFKSRMDLYFGMMVWNPLQEIDDNHESDEGTSD